MKKEKVRKRGKKKEKKRPAKGMDNRTKERIEREERGGESVVRTVRESAARRSRTYYCLIFISATGDRVSSRKSSRRRLRNANPPSRASCVLRCQGRHVRDRAISSAGLTKIDTFVN